MFLAIEGIDGCGKTTICTMLSIELEATIFKFPDDTTPIGKLIREHLNCEWTTSYRNRSEYEEDYLDALVFQALQLANRMEVDPELTHCIYDGGLVVADRYSVSGIIYGAADGLSVDHIEHIQKCLSRPDLQILLDVTPEVGLERRGHRGTTDDRYEAKTSFLYTVANKYREYFQSKMNLKDETTVWKIVDANRDEATVYKEVKKAISTMQGERA